MVIANAYFFVQVFSFIPVTRIFDMTIFFVEFCMMMAANDSPVNNRLKMKCCFQDMIDKTPPHEQGK